MIAILGTGSIAHSHVNAIRSTGREVSLVVNPNTESAELFAEAYGIKRFSGDFNDLLKDDIKVVHVCTPAALHYEEVKSLLENGKHVLCEKPLCLSSDEAMDLVKTAKEKSVCTAVDLNVRYNPACQKMKELVRAEEFGNIMLMHGEYLQEFELLPTAYTWRYKEPLAGKMRAVTETGTHLVDLMYFTSGLKIKSLCACFNKIQKDRIITDGMMYDASYGTEIQNGESLYVDSEDSAVVSYELENGVFGSFVLSEISSGHMNTVKLEIAGRGMDVSWNSDEAVKLNFASKGQPVNTLNFAFGNNGFNDTVCELVKDFYSLIDTGTASSSLPSFEDAAYLARVCEAVYESANNGRKWVNV